MVDRVRVVANLAVRVAAIYIIVGVDGEGARMAERKVAFFELDKRAVGDVGLAWFATPLCTVPTDGASFERRA